MSRLNIDERQNALVGIDLNNIFQAFCCSEWEVVVTLQKSDTKLKWHRLIESTGTQQSNQATESNATWT